MSTIARNQIQRSQQQIQSAYQQIQSAYQQIQSSHNQIQSAYQQIQSSRQQIQRFLDDIMEANNTNNSRDNGPFVAVHKLTKERYGPFNSKTEASTWYCDKHGDYVRSNNKLARNYIENNLSNWLNTSINPRDIEYIFEYCENTIVSTQTGTNGLGDSPQSSALRSIREYDSDSSSDDELLCFRVGLSNQIDE